MTYVGEIAALSTVLCWAIGTLSFEAAGRRIGSTTVNFIRLTIAWVILAIVGAVLAAAGVVQSDHTLILLNASPQEWLWLGMSGIVGFFLGDLCLFRAFVLIGPRLCTLVFTVAPLMTAILGWIILDETLTPLKCLGMAVTLGGIAWVVCERNNSRTAKLWRPSVWGVSLAALGALGQALGMVLAKKVINDDTDPIMVTHIRMTTAVPAFAVMFLLLRWHPRVTAGLKNRKAMAQLTLGACVGPVLGVILLMQSMKYLEAAVSQTFVALLPIVIIPFVMVIHKERVSIRAAIGAVIAVAGVAILFIK